MKKIIFWNFGGILPNPGGRELCPMFLFTNIILKFATLWYHSTETWIIAGGSLDLIPDTWLLKYISESIIEGNLSNSHPITVDLVTWFRDIAKEITLTNQPEAPPCAYHTQSGPDKTYKNLLPQEVTCWAISFSSEQNSSPLSETKKHFLCKVPTSPPSTDNLMDNFH